MAIPKYLINLNEFLDSFDDTYKALSPVHDYTGCTTELVESFKQFVKNSTLYKLACVDFEDDTENLIQHAALSESIWRDLAWNFKVTLRNFLALQEVTTLPFHGIKNDKKIGTTIVSMTYVDDTLTTVEATERSKDGAIVTTRFSSLFAAATQIFAAGFRRSDDMALHAELEEKYGAVFPQVETRYEFRGDSIVLPNMCNLENLWRKLHLEKAESHRSIVSPTKEKQRHFVAIMHERLYYHGIYEPLNVTMPIKHWQFIMFLNGF